MAWYWYGALPALPRLDGSLPVRARPQHQHGVDIIGRSTVPVHITNQYMYQWYTIWFYSEPYRYKLHPAIANRSYNISLSWLIDICLEA